MLLSVGECARAGAIHPSWVGYGHMPPGWSSERHTEQLKILVALPAPLESVTNVVLTGGKGSLNWGIHTDYIVIF